MSIEHKHLLKFKISKLDTGCLTASFEFDADQDGNLARWNVHQKIQTQTVLLRQLPNSNDYTFAVEFVNNVSYGELEHSQVSLVDTHIPDFDI